MPKSRRNVFRRSNNRKNRKSLKRQHGRKHFRKMTGGGLNEKYGTETEIKTKLMAKVEREFKFNTPKANAEIVKNTFDVLKATNTWDDYDINIDKTRPMMKVSHVIEALIDDVDKQVVAKESLSSFKMMELEKLENDKKKKGRNGKVRK